MRFTPEVVLEMYGQGAFPMTISSGEIEWFMPQDRCLFPLTGVRMSRSFRRALAREEYEIRFDTRFTDVMRNCVRESDNWLSEPFFEVYPELHRVGYGHSCEAFFEGELVGGVYGLAIGSCFCAESMFHRRSDAGKIALHHLILKCAEQGFRAFDAQLINDVTASLGAYEIPNADFLKILRHMNREKTPWTGQTQQL